MSTMKFLHDLDPRAYGIFHNLSEYSSGLDYLLSGALEESFKHKLLAESTIDLLYQSSKSGLDRRTRSTLRIAVISKKNNQEVRLFCEYLSVFDLSIKSTTPTSAVTGVIREVDSGICDHLLEDTSQRIGAAHALIAGMYPRLHYSIQEMIDHHSNWIQVFTGHHKRALELHQFVIERKLSVDNPQDTETLLSYAELPALAISSGAL